MRTSLQDDLQMDRSLRLYCLEDARTLDDSGVTGHYEIDMIAIL